MKLSALNKIKVTLASVSILFSFLQVLPQAQALTLSPPRLEVTGEPGQLLEGTLEIYNEELEERTFYISSQNFEARGETGSPFFLPNDGTGLASWISSGETVTLGARERAKFPYSIQVPQTAEPGGYFAAVFFGTTPTDPEDAGQVTIGGKVGTLIFLNIPGEAKEGAGIIEFMTEKGNLFAYLPVSMFYRFSNDGARKVMPVGTIEIKNMFGKVSATLDANEFKGNVLPGSIRKFSMVWETAGQDYTDEKVSSNQKPKTSLDDFDEGQPETEVKFFDAVKMEAENFALGKYTAVLDIKYGLDEKNATAQAVFYVVPWQLLSLMAGAALILLILGIILIKKYNRWIINKTKKTAQVTPPTQPPAPPVVNTISSISEPEPVQTAPTPQPVQSVTPKEPGVTQDTSTDKEEPKIKAKKTKKTTK